MSNDSRLANQIAAGDHEAFATLLDLYGARLHRLARRYAKNEADAEDLTQAIFFDIYRCIGTFRGNSQLSTWVYRVALNHCLRHQEKNQRNHAGQSESFDESLHESPDKSADPARHLAQSELSDQVQQALGTLSNLHRDVVILHELHGLTYSQCAAVLEVPVGTVKSRLSNAFRSLRGSLVGYVLGEEDNLSAVPTPSKPTHPEVLGDLS